ncbi:YncE family protein [Streptomyces boncukensis]|uniref:YncE family protein n=1 Tax=Streptomyces boncukensis TaxID=2711219 RepID=A0A6G4X0F9_9ACTN|nr:YncE family protein [Streptomyces boncukensis]NGO70347.1 YncE family protein [Streptomyces boncukensis]
MSDVPAPLPSAAAPSDVAGDLLAVAGRGGEAVVFFDTVSYRQVDAARVLPGPYELCLDASRQLLLCSHPRHGGHQGDRGACADGVSVIDLTTRRVVDPIGVAPGQAPRHLAVDERRGLLYISVQAPGGLVAVDLTDHRKARWTPTGAPGPRGFALTADGAKAYVAHRGEAFVSVVDLTADRPARVVSATGGGGLALSPDSREVFVAGPARGPHGAGGPGISVIDAASDRVVRVIPSERALTSVHTTATGAVLAGEVRSTPAGGPDNGRLHIFAPETFEPLGEVEVGQVPVSVHSSPDGLVGYVSNLLSRTVSVIDLGSGRLITELAVEGAGGAGPHGLAHLPVAL